MESARVLRCLAVFLSRLLQLIKLLLEIHIRKIVFVLAMALCSYQVTGLRLILVVPLVVGVMFGRTVQVLVLQITAILLTLYILTFMVFQTDLVPNHKTANCSDVQDSFSGVLLMNRPWFGLERLQEDETLLDKYKNYFLLLLTMTLQNFLYISQCMSRIDSGQSPRRPTIPFPKIDREKADENFENCIKFLCNYGFYKFGVEMCLVSCALLIALRSDLVAFMYCLWLVLLLCVSRRLLQPVWYIFMAFVTVCIFCQYVLAIASIPVRCYGDWQYLIEQIQTYFKLLAAPNQLVELHKLLADFLLLLILSRQSIVFRIERRYKHSNYPGGSNKLVYMEPYRVGFVNPVPSHIGPDQTWFDLTKESAFNMLFWATLTLSLWTGASRVNLFSLGYLVFAFIFLWVGMDVYTWRVKKILKWWNVFVGYTVGVIVLKTGLKVIGCSFLKHQALSNCWTEQLLGLSCSSDMKCSTEQGHSMYWDAACFALVLLQRRFFHSYYFMHHAEDAKASIALQHRGALLMENVQLQKLKEHRRKEQRALMKIKRNMERIKTSQIKKHVFVEPEDHVSATRMGDYVMFDNDENVMVEDNSDEEDSSNQPTRMTMLEFLGQVVGSKDEEAKAKDADLNPSSLSLAHADSETSKLGAGCSRSARDCQGNCFETVLRFLRKVTIDYRSISKALQEEKKKLQLNLLHREPSADAARLTWYTWRRNIHADDIVYQRYPRLVELLILLWYCLMSRSEDVCYLMVFIHQMLVPTLLSLPLTLLVFFWGSLTFIRPSMTFWITLIAFTEMTMAVKSLFQNDFFEWNGSSRRVPYDPFYPPVVLGIFKDPAYIVSGLVVLLVFFIHRFKLKSLGLWSSSGEVDEQEVPQDLGVYKLTDSNRDATNSYPNLPIQKAPNKTMAQVDSKGNFLYTVKETEADGLVTGEGRRLTAIGQNGDVFLTVSTDRNSSYPKTYKMSVIQHFTPIRQFLCQLKNNERRMTHDLYTAMFVCSFLNFLVILFGFSSFTETTPEDAEFYLADNEVPATYLVTLFIQFLVIVVDRIIYLRRDVLAKLVMQIILVVLSHAWMFFILPYITHRSFSDFIMPKIWYLIQCIYFLFSAYQIRAGYPVRVEGHFLCRKYGYVNLVCFTGLQFIPFFNQIRAILDFICIPSSLSINEWLKIHSIFQLIYLSKCRRVSEVDNKKPRGQTFPKSSKLSSGILMLLIIVAVMWFPLFFFAFVPAVAQTNPPRAVTLSVRIGTFSEIYTHTAKGTDIASLSFPQYKTLVSLYSNNKKTSSFLSKYDPEDVTVVKLKQNSAETWDISPDVVDTFINNTNRNVDDETEVYVNWRVTRHEKPGAETECTGETSTFMAAVEVNAALQENKCLRIGHVLPMFLQVQNDGLANPVPFLSSQSDLVNIEACMKFVDKSDPYAPKWWTIKDERCKMKKRFSMDVLNQTPHFSCNQITLYTFNEKVVPQQFLTLSKKGIMGIYISLVLVVWTLIRNSWLLYPTIMYEDMPNVDQILQLIYDIKLARQSGEFALEEDLYAKLLFLFRSPETIIKWTRKLEQ